jgi:hypothetical protein
MELSKQLPPSITVKFYVTPVTLDETKRVLSAVENSIRGIAYMNLAEGALRTDISGIARKYFEARLLTPSLDPSTFFGPYISNLQVYLKSKGVEIYNQNLDEYKTKQVVIDDIMNQRDLQQRQCQYRAKQYEAIEHDMVLWHFVKDKRPVYVESPVEAQYWIVTVDYRFLGFDAFKRKKEDGSVPVCIHPSALTQMLQFWVPRSEKLEEAILSSLRLPFLFHSFDSEAERITISILKTLSRFDDIKDLPVDTVANLLLSESLRNRMHGASEEAQQIELVKEALIKEHAKLAREHEQLSGQLKWTEEAAQRKDKTIEELQESFRRESEKRQSLEEKIEQNRREIDQLKRELLQAKEEKEHERRRREEEEKQRRIKGFLVKWMLIVPVLAWGGGSFMSMLIVGVSKCNLRTTLIVIESLVTIVWLAIMSSRAEKEPAKEHPVVRQVLKFRRWIFGTLATGILINALWDLIKKLWLR